MITGPDKDNWGRGQGWGCSGLIPYSLRMSSADPSRLMLIMLAIRP